MKKALLCSLGIILIVFAAWKTAPYGGNTFPSTGSVGIGTLSPAYLLEVSGGITRFDSIVKIGGGPSSNYGELDMCRQDGAVMMKVLSNASQTAFYGTGALTISPGNPAEVFTSGRWMMNGISDNGVDNFQVKGSILVDSIKAGGNLNDVLTRDASGYFVPKAPTGGSGLNGTFAPTLAAISNCSGLSGSIYYSANGKTVTINFSGGYIPTANSTATSFSVTIPNLGTFSSMLTGPLTANANGGSVFSAGMATWDAGTSKIDCKFTSPAAGAGGSGNVQFTIMYELQ